MGVRDRFAEHTEMSGAAGPALGLRRSALRICMTPLDDDAHRALCSALRREGLEHTVEGPYVHIAADVQGVSHLAARLASRLPRGLQSRVKALMADAPPDVGLALQAEGLPCFLGALDVAWAADALRNGWLFSVFQPILCASDGAIHAYEAFARARNPLQSAVAGAGQLIYACQRLNLEREFDLQARAAAIRDAARLGLFEHRVFVNFDPDAIYDPEVCIGRTVETASKAGVTMDRLVFEVVGSERLVRSDHLTAVLDYLRAQGASIALDDIGDGYSSLELVADLAPDYVKIGGALIASAVSSLSARRTLDAVVALTRQLRMRVIAAGVENAEQMRVALDSGVDFVQGYLFARPASPPYAVDPSAYSAWHSAA